MRTATTVCISLPQHTVDRLRQGAATHGMTFSGFMKIVIASGLESPLVKMLQQTEKEVDTDGSEV